LSIGDAPTDNDDNQKNRKYAPFHVVLLFTNKIWQLRELSIRRKLLYVK